MQTAGHVSGAVRFYQETDVESSLIQEEKSKLFPVCMHPNFGGWMALRGILVFPNICVPHLEKRLPPELIESQEEILQLLKLYNHHWRDNRFRDCVQNIKERYSKIQQDYFAQKPGPQRIEYLSKLIL